MATRNEVIILRGTNSISQDRLVINNNFQVINDSVADIRNILLSGSVNVNGVVTGISTFLPASIDFVDGNATPPSTNTDDIYIIIDEGNGSVDSGWNGAQYNDWVKYDGIQWIAVTPLHGYYNHKNSSDTLYYFDATNWVEAFSALTGSTPTIDDKDVIPSATSGDFQPTGVTITNTPQGYVDVKLNGKSYSVGNGIKTKDCYFSPDGGITARTIATIVAGDELIWNGTIAVSDLDTQDIISLMYNTL